MHSCMLPAFLHEKAGFLLRKEVMSENKTGRLSDLHALQRALTKFILFKEVHNEQ